MQRPRRIVRREKTLRRVNRFLKQEGQRLKVIDQASYSYWEARFYQDWVTAKIVDTKSNAVIRENIDPYALGRMLQARGGYEHL